MVKNKEVTELDQIPYMFSDYIEKFDAKLNPTKMILIMT